MEEGERERGFRAEVVHQVYVCSPAAGGTTERKVVSILCNAERQESARIRQRISSQPPSVSPGEAPLSLEFGTTLRDHRRKLRKKPSPPPPPGYVQRLPLPACLPACLPSCQTFSFASCMSAISIVYPQGFDFNARATRTIPGVLAKIYFTTSSRIFLSVLRIIFYFIDNEVSNYLRILMY